MTPSFSQLVFIPMGFVSVQNQGLDWLVCGAQNQQTNGRHRIEELEMKRTPSVIKLTPQWVRSLDQVQASHDGINYYPARPQGFWSFRYRAKAALMVFRGDADALVWPPFPSPPSHT